MSIERDQVQALLRRHGELKDKRAPQEALWRECEKWVDPEQQGGFYRRTPGMQRDAHITDNTAQLGIEAFVAAMDAMLDPEGEQTVRVKTTDENLNAVPAVAAWLQHASDRLWACRNAAHTGYAAASALRWRMLGIYGWQGMWIEEWVGRGLVYQTPHVSELFIDDDFRGRPDTTHRERTVTARQLQQMFDDAQLPANVKKALDENKVGQEFTLIHVIRPNSQYEPGRWDVKQFRYQSIYMLAEGNELISVGGFHSNPLPVSRYIVSPYNEYGTGPSGKVIGTIRQLNIMARDLIKASHLAIMPPVLMPEGGTLNRMSMTPGAPIVGGMEGGRAQIAPWQSGGQLAYTPETFKDYRAAVDQAFLVHVFAILNEPIDRQTATEYLGRRREAMILQAPNVGRQIAEALQPQVTREMEILARAQQIAPPPPQLREAGTSIAFEFDNPLTRAAKSADAQNFMGALQMLEPMAQFDPSVFDVIDTDAAPRGVMVAMGVRADWLASPEAVAAKQQQRQASQQAEQLATAAPAVSGAVLNLAKARSLPPVNGGLGG